MGAADHNVPQNRGRRGVIIIQDDGKLFGAIGHSRQVILIDGDLGFVIGQGIMIGAYGGVI